MITELVEWTKTSWVDKIMDTPYGKIVKNLIDEGKPFGCHQEV